MYQYNLLGSIIKYTMGSIVFINVNYFLRRYAKTTNRANIIITIICIGMLKVNKSYKLLSRTICLAVYSNINRKAHI